jgi:alpha-methylacyl-CoA racemase
VPKVTDETQMSSGPLAGVRIVEIAGLGPAPYASMLLADLGAEVIRVDRPGPAAAFGIPPEAALSNRGKRSVVVDLQTPEGVAGVLALVERADVLIEGFRPGVAERLGIGPDACLERNQRLVYGRMTGWGQTGPLSQAAGHDLNYLAITGALHSIGEKSRGPVPPLNLLGDYAGGGLFLVVGVLAALREADKTGRGQVVDAAIVDGVSHMLASVHAMLNTARWKDERQSNLVDGGMPFYSVYETRDGKYVALGAIEPKFFAEFVARSGVAVDPAKQYVREGWEEMRAEITATIASRTQDDWVQVFDGSDACVSPVLSLREAPDHPHIADRQTIRRDGNGLMQPTAAPRFSLHPDTGAAHAIPLPGEHTAEIFDELGITLGTDQ